MFAYFTLACSLSYIFSNLDKKLMILLVLEVSFLMMACSYFLLDFHYYKLSLIMFIFCSLMVMDSVFGLSILVSCGRSSGSTLLKRPVF